MSIYPVLCDHVSLPSSHIRAPGSLLKHANYKIRAEPLQEQIQRHLANFKKMLNDDTEEGIPNSWTLRPRAQSQYLPDLSDTDSRVNPEMKKIISLIRAKSSVCEVEFLVKKASQIFTLYGIELVVEVTEKYYDELYKLLAHFVPELCLFPVEFLNKLEIKHLFICEKAQLKELSVKYPKRTTAFFVLDSVETEAQVYRELYKIIFNQLIQIDEKLVEEWESCMSVEAASILLNAQDDLEAAYLCLMQNTNHALYKAKTEKLMKILSRKFPQDLSEEWFKNRKKEKKKQGKVRIGSSITTFIVE